MRVADGKLPPALTELPSGRLLLVEDVAEYLGVTVPYVYQLARENAIPSMRLGKGRGFVRFLAEDIEAWARSLRTPPSRPPLMDSGAVMAYLALKSDHVARQVMKQAGAYNIGNGRLRIDRADLDRWLRANAASSEPIRLHLVPRRAQ